MENKEVVDNISQATENAMNKMADLSKQTTSTVSGVATNSLSEMKNAYNKLATDSGAIWGLVAIVVVSIVCALIIYTFVVTSVFKKLSVTVKGTKYPLKGEMLSVVPLNDIPSSSNGQRRTYTFWIYLNDMNSNNGMYKNVWSIGSSPPDSKLNKYSPSVFLDKATNKMHMRFSKNSNQQSGDLTSDSEEQVMKTGITLDYIPLQRWSHIAIVLNDNYQGGNITAYIDGELAKSVNHKEEYNGVEKDYNDLNIDMGGKLYVGGDKQQGGMAGFSGLLSKVSIHNYDLNQRDIIKDYQKGPIDNMLAALGYGVRAPIYKL
jgi:hypothetical protein